MRDDPYPARFDSRLHDELLITTADLPLAPIQLRPITQRLLLLLLTIYLLIAIFLMATAAGYAAPAVRAAAPAFDCQCGVKYRPY